MGFEFFEIFWLVLGDWVEPIVSRAPYDKEECDPFRKMLELWMCFKKANGDSPALDDGYQDIIRRSRLHVDQEVEHEMPLGDKLFLPSQKDQALRYIEQLESVDLSKRYRNRHKIGKGEYGKVFKVKRDGKIYAVNTIEVTKEVGNAVSVANEIIIMMNVLKSPNLVRAYNAFFIEEKGKIVIEMDYIKGMDMVDYVNERKVLWRQ